MLRLRGAAAALESGMPVSAPSLTPPCCWRRRLVRALAATPVGLLAGCATATTAPTGDLRNLPSPGDAARRLQAALGLQPLVLLGEVHDNADQHRLRAEALARWLADGARPALLMEQFDRERQAELDAAMAAPGTDADSRVEAVINAGWPQGRTGWDWTFYRPFIALALQYRLPLVAANVSRTDTRRIVTGGLAAAGFDPAVPPDIAKAQADTIVASHCGQVDERLARQLMQAQVARDQFMARQLVAHAATGAVLLAGNGHVRRDIGVPRWLPPAWQRRSMAIGLLEAGEAPEAAFDLALVTPAAQRGDPCEGMARIPQRPAPGTAR